MRGACFDNLKVDKQTRVRMEKIMNELMMVVGVAGLFLLRIGIPVLLLIGVGLLIDRWQSKREDEMQREYRKPS